MERELGVSAANVLAALVSRDVESNIAPDEFMVNDYIAEYERQTGEKISRSTADSRLEKRVESGELTKRMARCGGRDVRAYRKADGTQTNQQPDD